MNTEENDSLPVGPQSEVSYELEAHASPSIATVMAIADFTGTDPTDVPCLYEYVNLDAVDALVEAHDSRDGELTLTFTVKSVAVTIAGTDSVTVRPLASADATGTPMEEA